MKLELSRAAGSDQMISFDIIVRCVGAWLYWYDRSQLLEWLHSLSGRPVSCAKSRGAFGTVSAAQCSTIFTELSYTYILDKDQILRTMPQTELMQLASNVCAVFQCLPHLCWFVCFVSSKLKAHQSYNWSCNKSLM